MAWVVTSVIVAAELMTAAAIFTAVAQVGIALQVVGTVTKSKEMMKIGKIMGAVGAVGGLVSAGVTALTSAAADGAVGVAEGAMVDAASDVAGEQFAIEAGMDAAGSAFGDAAADAAVSTFPVDVGLGGMMQTGGTQAATGAAGVAAPAANIAAPTAAGSVAPQSAESMFNAELASGATPAAFDIGSVGSVAAPADTSSFGITKWFNSLEKPMQEKVISGAMQIGGSAVGGLFNGWTEEQKMALERERQALQQRNIDQQQSNANAQPRVAAYVRPTGMMGS